MMGWRQRSQRLDALRARLSWRARRAEKRAARENPLPPGEAIAEKWSRLLVGGIPDPELQLDVRPGEWYFGVYCTHCTTPVPVFHDRGRGNLIAIGGGTLTVTCRHCGTSGSYGTDSMVSFFVANRDGEGT